jgi:hypothetical protein
LLFFSDALQATVTALYCKILVILGLAFPMAEVISENVPKGYYQVSNKQCQVYIKNHLLSIIPK